MPDETVTARVGEVARAARVSKQTVRNWLRPGRDGSPPVLRGIVLGGILRVPVDQPALAQFAPILMALIAADEAKNTEAKDENQ